MMTYGFLLLSYGRPYVISYPNTATLTSGDWQLSVKGLRTLLPPALYFPFPLLS